MSVARGFMAARATSSAPVDIPPSVPPARSESRRYSPEASSQLMGSWASEPLLPATSKPSPSSTPFTA